MGNAVLSIAVEARTMAATAIELVRQHVVSCDARMEALRGDMNRWFEAQRDDARDRQAAYTERLDALWRLILGVIGAVILGGGSVILLLLQSGHHL
jgi:hypothetical protein